MQAKELCRALQEVDPYANFDYHAYPHLPSQGVGGSGRYIYQMVCDTKPGLIVEVGSWLGESARNMARALRDCNLYDSRIVCVDTWLGALEYWREKTPGHYYGMKLKNGYPTMYQQFLANTCYEGLQDWITPLPLPSQIAALLLGHYQARADLIYIDASHEEEFVLQDLRSWRPLLSERGVMFGDDYFLETVARAVHRAADEWGCGGVAVTERYWKLGC